MIRSAARCWTLALLLGPSLPAQVAVVPTDAQLPGTQALEVVELESASLCMGCHSGYDPAAEPGHGWSGTMMAHAGRDPMLWAAMAIAEQDFPGAGDLCLRCHSPQGWLAGRSTPTDGSGLAATDDDGVSCDLCHRLTDPDGSGWPGAQGVPFLAHDESPSPEAYHGNGEYVVTATEDPKLGPYSDALGFHGVEASAFSRDAALCGTCHDVSNPVVGDLAPGHGAQLPLDPGTFSGTAGTPVDGKAAFNNFPFQYGVVERTYSEHQAGALAQLPVADFPVLPGELRAGMLQAAYDAATAVRPDGNYADGTLRTFTCQTCHMPPVSGRAASMGFLPVRDDLASHDLTGGNYWMGDVIAYLDGLGKLVLGGGLWPNELAALGDAQDRARDRLGQSAALKVVGDTVRVVNLTGHKLISGYPEGRRMWLRVRWLDGTGQLLREDGAYGALSVDIGGQPASVDTILDLSGANTRVYEAHMGVSAEWAQKLLTQGLSPGLPLEFDRITGAVTATLADAASEAPGTATESFHFVLNDTLLKDNRIPPFGMRRDDALQRNIVPVPAAQYGNPGPGGTYDHFDVLALQPPPGAVSATIDLLYQPTSWEYIQFLARANDGSVTRLASTGDDLLGAWQATGMAAPEVMASASWPAPHDPWVDLGLGLAGTAGYPTLSGAGSLAGGDPFSLTLAGARPFSLAALVYGFARLDMPYKGGVLLPSFAPPGGYFMLPTDGAGGFALGSVWPAGIPGGLTLFTQVWVSDPAGPKGWAATNGLAGTTP